MNDTKKIKDASPLVQSVLSVDNHVNQLERLSERISEMKLNTEADYEQARKLMGHFAEHGEAVSTEIVELSKLLLSTRTRAEAAASKVAARADIVQDRRNIEEEKMAALRALAAKVIVVGQSIQDLNGRSGGAITEDDRAYIVQRMNEVDSQIEPLIEEARELQASARESRLKSVEQQADSLTQSLVNVRKKLATVTQAGAVRS
jgi:chromosome segregation ATPase